MYRTSALVRRAARIVLAAALLAGSLALASCGEAEKRDVPDTSGLFHFKVPAKWAAASQNSMISIYADDELPAEGEAYEKLSLVILTSRTASSLPIDEALADLVTKAAESRKWTDTEIGEPYDAAVGGRKASRVDLTGTDQNGRAFAAAYIWVRTLDADVLVYAVTPRDDWDKWQEDLDTILTEWYWQKPDPENEVSTEESATADGASEEASAADE
jgi:hypothetical protein